MSAKVQPSHDIFDSAHAPAEAKPAHSPIGASSMYRWSHCPGSRRLVARCPQTSSEYAEEGTRAHAVAAALLTRTSYLETLDEEGRAAVWTYVSAIQSELEADPTAQIWVEHRFDISDLYPELFGTADCVIYSPTTKTLKVFDYKHGAGVPVEILEDGEPNPQLLYYALGAVRTLPISCKTIEIVIAQPRCPHPDGPIRRHNITVSDLLDFEEALVEFARSTDLPDAPLNPGKWCRFCPASGICPSLQTKALALAQKEFTPQLSYDPDDLSRTLEWLPVFEAWIKSVREFAYAEAQHGRVPPGWKLVAKRANRKWASNVTEDDIIRNTILAGKRRDDALEVSVKSPAQIEKLVGKEKFEQGFSTLIVQESSGTTLAPSSDKRPPALIDVSNEFSPTTLKPKE